MKLFFWRFMVLFAFLPVVAAAVALVVFAVTVIWSWWAWWGVLGISWLVAFWVVVAKAQDGHY